MDKGRYDSEAESRRKENAQDRAAILDGCEYQKKMAEGIGLTPPGMPNGDSVIFWYTDDDLKQIDYESKGLVKILQKGALQENEMEKRKIMMDIEKYWKMKENGGPESFRSSKVPWPPQQREWFREFKGIEIDKRKLDEDIKNRNRGTPHIREQEKET